MHYSNKFLHIFFAFIFTLILFSSQALSAQNTSFTLVIDPGHGGSDPGAVGAVAKEKNINLAVALEVGKLIEKEHSDVKVFYTRKTDKYLALDERATFANDKKADLFISIHTNSAKNKAAYGAETFTLGLAKSEANMAVAMRENSVMLLEEDYKTKYKGFDPSSVDSYIMFEFMQDKYIDQSLEFATFTQEQFTNYCKRRDRGVRQAGFLVLHQTAAPSVLIELGFISNKEEEKYLNSKDGQQKMATAVSKAFTNYKHNHDRKSGKTTANADSQTSEKPARPAKPLPKEPKQSTTDTAATIETTKTTEVTKPAEVTDNNTNQKEIVFKVQLFAGTKKLPSTAPEFKGLKDIGYYEEGNLYKYTAGNETEYQNIVSLKKEINKKYPEAFIIAFLDGKKIAVTEALKQIK